MAKPGDYLGSTFSYDGEVIGALWRNRVVTSEAEVLWILLVPRLRLRTEPARRGVEDRISGGPGHGRQSARPPEGRKSGVYPRGKVAAK